MGFFLFFLKDVMKCYKMFKNVNKCSQMFIECYIGKVLLLQ